MRIDSGASWGLFAAALFLFGAVAFGHATVAIQGGASPDEPGIVSFRTGTKARRHRPGSKMTLGNQRLAGATGMVVGLGAGAVGIVLPLLLRESDED